MINTSIRIEGGIGGPSSNLSVFFTAKFVKIGNFAIQTERARLARGVGVDDAPMPPLSGRTSAILRNGNFVRQRAGWADWKSRHGLQSFRDLYGDGRQGGHMLDNLSVRSANASSVRIDFTSRSARTKAQANSKRANWHGFSPSDQVKIAAFAMRELFGEVNVVDNRTLDAISTLGSSLPIAA